MPASFVVPADMTDAQKTARGVLGIGAAESLLSQHDHPAAGCASQIARGVLPNSLASRIIDDLATCATGGTS